MPVYRLEYDGFKYPVIDISEDEFERKSFPDRRYFAYGISKIPFWTVVEGTCFHDPENPHPEPCPDLSQWHHGLVLSERARETLEGCIGSYGEFLPIDVEGQRRFVFNLTTSTEAIDPFNSSKTELDGVDLGVDKIAFLEHEVADLLIFSTSYDLHAYTYCTHTFKELVEQSGLSSGWHFRTELR